MVIAPGVVGCGFPLRVFHTLAGSFREKLLDAVLGTPTGSNKQSGLAQTVHLVDIDITG
eukprot:m.657794 g.657794  ORF g.657794 m.657794 type:complete len:59 (+) comp58438_c0_seq10:1233-1409(+)